MHLSAYSSLGISNNLMTLHTADIFFSLLNRSVEHRHRLILIIGPINLYLLLGVRPSSLHFSLTPVNSVDNVAELCHTNYLKLADRRLFPPHLLVWFLHLAID